MTSKDFQRLNDFIPYFNSFYGVGGIYSHGRNYTSADIIKALCVLFVNKPNHVFEGDSMDREFLRDIMLESATMIKHFEKKVA